MDTRYDEDQGPTRIIMWSENSESDLSSVVVGVCALALFIGSIVCAIELHGIPHTVAIVIAVLSGIYVALMTIPILLFTWAVVAIEGAMAEKPSLVQRASWVAGAVLIGAVLGSDAYAEGFPSLLIGPGLMLAAVAALPALNAVPPRLRRAFVKLTAITAISAVAVGLTIFL